MKEIIVLTTMIVIALGLVIASIIVMCLGNATLAFGLCIGGATLLAILLGTLLWTLWQIAEETGVSLIRSLFDQPPAEPLPPRG
jgi:uncharacterized transporter YbjL